MKEVVMKEVVMKEIGKKEVRYLPLLPLRGKEWKVRQCHLIVILSQSNQQARLLRPAPLLLLPSSDPTDCYLMFSMTTG